MIFDLGRTGSGSGSDGSNPTKSIFPGAVVRVSGSGEEKSGREIPYCSMSQAQLSFHGHRDAVKFFVAVPGAPFSDTHGMGLDLDLQRNN